MPSVSCPSGLSSPRSLRALSLVPFSANSSRSRYRYAGSRADRSGSCADTTKMPPSLLLLRRHPGWLRVQDLALRGVIRHWPQEIFLLVHLHVEYRVGVPTVNLRAAHNL